jgi:hypothetical protein
MLLMSSNQPKYGRVWKKAQVVAAGDASTEVPGDPDELVGEADAARLIPPRGVSVRTMSRYRSAGLVAFFRISGQIFYRRADLQAFVDSLRTPASGHTHDAMQQPNDQHLEFWRLIDGDI